MKLFVILVLLSILSCKRLYYPPKPLGVYDKANYIHRFQQWQYSDDSIELIWYSDGSIHKKIEKKNHLYHGLYQVFFRNGQISQTGNYQEGYRVGKWYYYYPDGKIYLILTYEKEPYDETIFNINGYYGNENGEYIRYYSNNNVEEIGYYKAGKLHGKRIRFYKNGNKQFEILYKNGKKDGIAKYFDFQGNLKRTIEYRENNEIIRKFIN